MKGAIKPLFAAAEDILGTAVLIAVFTVMLMGVFFRYVFNDSLVWSEEFARYGLVMMTFLGIGTGFRKATHVRIDAVNRYVSGAAARVIDVLCLLASLAFLIFLAAQGIGLSRVLRASRSAALGLPMSWLYFGITFALMIGAIRVMFVLLRQFRPVK